MKAFRHMRSWRARRRAEQEQAQLLLTKSLLAFIGRLRGRLDKQAAWWAAENAGQTEWEDAIETIRTEIRAGRVVLTDAEQRQLEEIENSRLLDRKLLPPESRIKHPNGAESD